jgi:hypothetical protein
MESNMSENETPSNTILDEANIPTVGRDFTEEI